MPVLSNRGAYVRRFAHAPHAVGDFAGGGGREGDGGGGTRRREHRDGRGRLAGGGEARCGAAERVLVGGDTPAQRGNLHRAGPRSASRALGVTRHRSVGGGGIGLLSGGLVEGDTAGALRGRDLAGQRHASAPGHTLQGSVRRYDGYSPSRPGSGCPALLRGRGARGEGGSRTRLLSGARR